MKALSQLALLMIFCFTAWAGKGGMDGGGGVGVGLPDGKVLFYDLYLADPLFRDDFQNVKPILVSKFAKTVGFDRMPEIVDSAEFALAQQRLRLWQKSSPTVVETLAQAMSSMDWRYMPYRRALLESAPSGHNLQQVIVFVKGLGAVISSPVWNKMGLRSRAAAIVHESLRHVQFEYQGASTDLSMSEKTLIDLTAAIMLREPLADETWDRPELFSGMLGKTLASRETAKQGVIKLRENVEAFLEQLEKEGLSQWADHFRPAAEAFLANPDDVELARQFMGKVGFEVMGSLSASADVRRRAKLIVFDIDLVITERALANINSRSAQLMDLTAQLNGVMPQVLFEDKLRRYVAGDRGGMSRKEKDGWEKVVKFFQDAIAQAKAAGNLIEDKG